MVEAERLAAQQASKVVELEAARKEQTSRAEQVVRPQLLILLLFASYALLLVNLSASAPTPRLT